MTLAAAVNLKTNQTILVLSSREVIFEVVVELNFIMTVYVNTNK